MHDNKFANQQLHLALYNKTIQVVEATGLPFFIIDKSKQLGNNFGEKLGNAIDFGFTKNYHSVIAIGSDCPQLSPDILLDAADKMSHQQMVLGPDKNGGIYLLGITLDYFNAKAISDIPWQTKSVFASLLAYKNCLLKDVSILDELSDFNKICDYRILKNILHSIYGFIKLITKIVIGEKIQRNVILLPNYTFRFTSIKQLRAPPILLINN